MEGAGAGLADAIPVNQGAHRDAIRSNHALEAELHPEEVRDDLAGDGGNLIRIEMRVDAMRDHDGIETGGDELLVGIELNLVETRGVHIEHGAGVVRVGRGVAAARKVLGGGDDAGVLKTLHHGGGVIGDDLGIVAKGAVANLGVVGVDIHVHHRRVNHIEPGRFHLETDRLGDLVGELRTAASDETHVGRELHHAAAREVLAGVVFLIDDHVQRDGRLARGGEGTELVQHGGVLLRRAVGRLTDVGDFLHRGHEVRAELLLLRFLVGEIAKHPRERREPDTAALVAENSFAEVVRDDRAGHADDDALADFLLERYLAERGFNEGFFIHGEGKGCADKKGAWLTQ